MKNVIEALQKLKTYCEAEDFKGWDPFDGLNSKVLRAVLPLKSSAILRLIVIQGFKRSPYNLRPLMRVPKQHNAKGIGLFLQGYCNLYRVVTLKPELSECFGDKKIILKQINYLAGLLQEMRSTGYHGSCWGYNFDWQSRRLFLFPANCPTIVATTFCATALVDAYEVTGNKSYLDTALDSADFVLKDLHLDEYKSERMISYSPLEGNNLVSNASLLGSKLLATIYKYTGRTDCLQTALSSVKACVAGQEQDGSWTYSFIPPKLWKDSFHTGYNLDGLIGYQEMTGDKSFEANIERGFDYYIKTFFKPDGSPMYYNDKQFPIDIHCPGQLLVTLCRMHRLSKHKELAERVVYWTLNNMWDEKGFFYYQLKEGKSSKIPYMRWSNAFMFNALTFYLLETINFSTDDIR